GILLLEGPPARDVAGLAPSKSDAAVRHHDTVARIVECHGLPSGVIVLREPVGKIVCAKISPCDPAAVALLEAHEQRQVCVAANVFVEVLALPVEVPLLE